MDSSLAVLLTIAGGLQVFLFALFGRFEVPRWKVLSKIGFYFVLTWILATAFGWWSVIWIAGHPALGVVAHAFWCGNHGIDWRTCEPRDEYLRLRPWRGDSFANAD